MDCARFEAEMVALLAEGGSGRERDARIRRLRAHAESCDGCRGSVDLLDWSALPERDGFEVPDDAYWASFDERLRQRLEGRGGRRSWRPWAILATAALVGLALLVTWSLRPGRSTEVARTEPAPTHEGIDDSTRVAAADDELEGLLGTLEAWYGFDPDGAGGPGPDRADGLFPSTADLDADARRDLIDWLREEEARLGEGAV
jgi:hypothetical protein